MGVEKTGIVTVARLENDFKLNRKEIVSAGFFFSCYDDGLWTMMIITLRQESY